MKTTLSKKEAQEKITDFFKSKDFTAKEMKKIRRLAMKHQIKLGPLRKKFCKKCLNPLKGKTKITKTHKMIECKKCNHKAKFRI
tara:strand:- start:208 stop:459 length:252 start_codon:yes stop_codon:yes gene_type:complete